MVVMSDFALRPYHPSDLPRLYDICLATGDSGADATGIVDPELLGHYFLAPYCWFDASLCFVLCRSGTPVGYIVAAADSQAFAERCETHWWPTLRNRYDPPVHVPDGKLSSARLIELIHRGYTVPSYAVDYPAHMHIDLLPTAQGIGQGRVLMDALVAALAERGVAGLHLGVGLSNQRAITFYKRYGFHEIESGPGYLALGIHIG